MLEKQIKNIEINFDFFKNQKIKKVSKLEQTIRKLLWSIICVSGLTIIFLMCQIAYYIG